MQIVVPYCVRTAGGQSRGKGSQPQAAKAEQGQPQAADKEAPWRARPATGGQPATGGRQRSAVASKASKVGKRGSDVEGSCGRAGARNS